MDDDNEPIAPRHIDGLDALFEELERYCYSTAIVTLVGATGAPFRFDLERDGERIKYGHEEAHAALIRARTLRIIADSEEAAVTVRSFLDETHPDTTMPYKEIRSFRVRLVDDRISAETLPAEAVLDAYTTDASTGESLEPEPEAIYCGPETCIRGESL